MTTTPVEGGNSVKYDYNTCREGNSVKYDYHTCRGS